jgi:hypothetical protein
MVEIHRLLILFIDSHWFGILFIRFSSLIEIRKNKYKQVPEQRRLRKEPRSRLESI